MWSPSCVGTEPVKSEVRRLSAWVGLGGAGSRRAEALTATISTAASDAARNPPKGPCTLRREIPVVTVPRLPTRLELFTRADIANGRGALQADVGVGIFLHAFAQDVRGMSVGVHLALGGQITQRIDGLDPHSGILVFHQSVLWLWLPGGLPASALESNPAQIPPAHQRHERSVCRRLWWCRCFR